MKKHVVAAFSVSEDTKNKKFKGGTYFFYSDGTYQILFQNKQNQYTHFSLVMKVDNENQNNGWGKQNTYRKDDKGQVIEKVIKVEKIVDGKKVTESVTIKYPLWIEEKYAKKIVGVGKYDIKKEKSLVEIFYASENNELNHSLFCLSDDHQEWMASISKGAGYEIHMPKKYKADVLSVSYLNDLKIIVFFLKEGAYLRYNAATNTFIDLEPRKISLNDDVFMWPEEVCKKANEISSVMNWGKYNEIMTVFFNDGNYYSYNFTVFGEINNIIGVIKTPKNVDQGFAHDLLEDFSKYYNDRFVISISNNKDSTTIEYSDGTFQTLSRSSAVEPLTLDLKLNNEQAKLSHLGQGIEGIETIESHYGNFKTWFEKNSQNYCGYIPWGIALKDSFIVTIILYDNKIIHFRKDARENALDQRFGKVIDVESGDLASILTDFSYEITHPLITAALNCVCPSSSHYGESVYLFFNDGTCQVLSKLSTDELSVAETEIPVETSELWNVDKDNKISKEDAKNILAIFQIPSDNTVYYMNAKKEIKTLALAKNNKVTFQLDKPQEVFRGEVRAVIPWSHGKNDYLVFIEEISGKPYLQVMSLDGKIQPTQDWKKGLIRVKHDHPEYMPYPLMMNEEFFMIWPEYLNGFMPYLRGGYVFGERTKIINFFLTMGGEIRLDLKMLQVFKDLYNFYLNNESKKYTNPLPVLGSHSNKFLMKSADTKQKDLFPLYSDDINMRLITDRIEKQCPEDVFCIFNVVGKARILYKNDKKSTVEIFSFFNKHNKDINELKSFVKPDAEISSKNKEDIIFPFQLGDNTYIVHYIIMESIYFYALDDNKGRIEIVNKFNMPTKDKKYQAIYPVINNGYVYFYCHNHQHYSVDIYSLVIDKNSLLLKLIESRSGQDNNTDVLSDITTNIFSIRLGENICIYRYSLIGQRYVCDVLDSKGNLTTGKSSAELKQHPHRLYSDFEIPLFPVSMFGKNYLISYRYGLVKFGYHYTLSADAGIGEITLREIESEYKFSSVISQSVGYISLETACSLSLYQYGPLTFLSCTNNTSQSTTKYTTLIDKNLRIQPWSVISSDEVKDDEYLLSTQLAVHQIGRSLSHYSFSELRNLVSVFLHHRHSQLNPDAFIRCLLSIIGNQIDYDRLRADITEGSEKYKANHDFAAQLDKLLKMLIIHHRLNDKDDIAEVLIRILGVGSTKKIEHELMKNIKEVKESAQVEEDLKYLDDQIAHILAKSKSQTCVKVLPIFNTDFSIETVALESKSTLSEKVRDSIKGMLSSSMSNNLMLLEKLYAYLDDSQKTLTENEKQCMSSSNELLKMLRGEAESASRKNFNSKFNELQKRCQQIDYLQKILHVLKNTPQRPEFSDFCRKLKDNIKKADNIDDNLLKIFESFVNNLISLYIPPNLPLFTGWWNDIFLNTRDSELIFDALYRMVLIESWLEKCFEFLFAVHVEIIKGLMLLLTVHQVDGLDEQILKKCQFIFRQAIQFFDATIPVDLLSILFVHKQLVAMRQKPNSEEFWFILNNRHFVCRNDSANNHQAITYANLLCPSIEPNKSACLTRIAAAFDVEEALILLLNKDKESDKLYQYVQYEAKDKEPVVKNINIADNDSWDRVVNKSGMTIVAAADIPKSKIYFFGADNRVAYHSFSNLKDMAPLRLSAEFPGFNPKLLRNSTLNAAMVYKQRLYLIYSDARLLVYDLIRKAMVNTEPYSITFLFNLSSYIGKAYQELVPTTSKSIRRFVFDNKNVLFKSTDSNSTQFKAISAFNSINDKAVVHDQGTMELYSNSNM